jgi:hypothetical protein
MVHVTNVDHETHETGEKVVGKYWAAVSGDMVINLISMRVPNSVDFDTYRNKAVDCLGMLGDVKTGEVVLRDGKHVFVQRKNHYARSKQGSAKPAKEYAIHQAIF